MKCFVVCLALFVATVFGDAPVIAKKVLSKSEVDFSVLQFQEVNSESQVVREISKFGRFEYTITGVQSSTAFGKKTTGTISMPILLSDGSSGKLEITVSTFGVLQWGGESQDILTLPENPAEISYKLEWPELLHPENKFQMSSEVGYSPSLQDAFTNLQSTFQPIYGAMGVVVGYKVPAPINIIINLPDQVHESKWEKISFSSNGFASLFSSRRVSAALAARAQKREENDCYCFDDSDQLCDPNNQNCAYCTNCYNPNTNGPCNGGGDCYCCQWSSASNLVMFSAAVILACLALLL